MEMRKMEEMKNEILVSLRSWHNKEAAAKDIIATTRTNIEGCVLECHDLWHRELKIL